MEDLDYPTAGEFSKPSDYALKQRMGFITKVYGILSSQLLLTTVFCIVPMFSPALKQFLLSTTWLLWLCFLTGLITLLVLACSQSVAQNVPVNYVLLAVFTVSEAYIVGSVCCYYDSAVVAQAAFLTMVVVLGLTVYACLGKDFTQMQGIMLVVLFAFVGFAVLAMVSGSELMRLVYCLVGVVIFGIYLVIDTQLIIGGFSYELSYDDYIMAAMMLYLDIINIFLKLLELFGRSE